MPETTISPAEKPGHATPFDLLRSNAEFLNRLPDMSVVFERLFRAFRTRVFQSMRRNLSGSDEVQGVILHDDYLTRSSERPCLYAMLATSPLRGTVLACIDGEFLGALTDDLFGGSGLQSAGSATGALSAMERRVGEDLARLLAQAVDDALGQHLPARTQVLRTETHAALASVADAAEPYFQMAIRFAIPTGSGEISIALPYHGLELHREALSAPAGLIEQQGADEDWGQMLDQAVDTVPFEIAVEIGTVTMPIARLQALTVGDEIEVTMHATALLKIDEVTVAECTCGAFDEYFYGVRLKDE